MGDTLYDLTTEGPEDHWEVEALYDLTFAPGRKALSSYRLRDSVPPIPDLCRLARDGEGILAGAIRVWPIHIKTAAGGALLEALLLGPVAVHPTRQGEGLGQYLIRDCLARAQATGHQRVLLVGDASYYRKFGFEHLDGIEMPPPTNPARVLGQGDWQGIRGTVVPYSSPAR